jgi:hypothetical protein
MPEIRMPSRRQRTLVVLALAGLVPAVAGCTVINKGADDESASGNATATAQPAPPAVATSAGPPAGGQPQDPDTCFLGTFAVVSITSVDGAATPFGTARPSGDGGSLMLALSPNNTWKLSSDGSRPVKFQVGAFTADALIKGSERGTYRRSGTSFQFEEDSSEGTVTLTTPVGSQEIDMDEVGQALTPRGAATITCGPDTVDFASESVKMTLRHT